MGMLNNTIGLYTVYVVNCLTQRRRRRYWNSQAILHPEPLTAPLFGRDRQCYAVPACRRPGTHLSWTASVANNAASWTWYRAPTYTYRQYTRCGLIIGRHNDRAVGTMPFTRSTQYQLIKIYFSFPCPSQYCTSSSHSYRRRRNFILPQQLNNKI